MRQRRASRSSRLQPQDNLTGEGEQLRNPGPPSDRIILQSCFA